MVDGEINEEILTVSGEEGNGSTLLAGTTSTTNTVDVILRVVGVVIVEHMCNVAHILKEYRLAGKKSMGYSNVPAWTDGM